MSKIIATRPDSTEYAPYYGKYVALVGDGDILTTLDQQINNTLALLRSVSEDKADYRYAQDKWSIKEVAGHLIDAERMFAYRALCFGRNDPKPLSGFEPDDYVKNGGFGARHLSDLASEFEHVRRANIYMLRGFSGEAWDRRGIASGNEISVKALAYIIAGHELHHLKIIQTRYL